MKPITNILFGLGLICLIPFSSVTHNNLEICDNAMDDDGDGLIDFQDDDCTCEFVELRSLIPNPSFEDMLCCPDGHYQLDCTTSWIQAYGMTPDYIHTCGWMGPEQLTVPEPFPDGDAVVGFLNGKVPQILPIEWDWKEYAGTCLLGTMEAGKTYRIEFSLGFASILASPPLDLTLYGTDNCANFPFGIDIVLPGCPTNFPEWVKLESKVIEASSPPMWVSDYFEFTPDQDIRAIAIGGPCEHFSGERSEYYYLDNLIMEETYRFEYQIKESGDPCGDNFTLSVSASTPLAYQWYKDSIALVGETGSSLQVDYGDGHYQVRMIEEDGCRMSPPYLFIKPLPQQTAITATICEGDTYVDGDFSASTEGNYTYILPASSGCDSLINLQLEYCKLYLPNVFSPNSDGVNDTFKVLDDETIREFTILIYDRWGGLVYEGIEWDGRVNGEPAPQGVYVYFVNLITTAGKTLVRQGSVTLIR